MDEKRRSNKQYSSKSYKKGRGKLGTSSKRYLDQASNSTAPEDLAEYIFKILAKDPDSLQFDRQVPYPGRSRLVVKCDPQITGRLIGKEGKTISSLRSLIRAAANKYGKRIDIEIAN